jgi:secreted trypsin-like serine protease
MHRLSLCMKKLVFISSFFLISYVAMSQKVTVQVIKTEKTALSEWQILDEKYNIVFSGNEYFRADSVTFFLDANKRYFLQISVTEIYNHDSNLYTLILNNEPVILIKSDIGPGGHIYPFFTGMRNERIKITGGAEAVISDFPWQVYFISGNFRCGGSIIADKWILTAAHCTHDDLGNPIPAISMSVKVGSSLISGQTYNVSQVIVNEGYDKQTLANDIALLKLTVPINNINARPIKLVTSDDVINGATDPGVLSTVTGWGYTQANTTTSVPVKLQKVQLPIITIAQASTVWGTIPSTDIMAGLLNGNKDACNGDSGGPMMVPVPGEYKLAGIVSWGSSDCNTYGAYTRVSMFENWIRFNTGIAPLGDTLVCKGVVSSQYTVSNVPSATAYEWRLLPANAGSVSGTSSNATVIWNTGFSGSSKLVLMVTINNVVSEWTRLYPKVVLNTKLLSQSTDTIACAEQPVTLKVVAEGYNLIYKWSKNGIQVQSGPSSKLNISSTSTDNSGVYNCEITGYCGTVFSSNINLTVFPLTKITSVSPDVEVPFGKNVTLEVSAQGHDLIYHWQKDNVLLNNSSTSRLFLQGLNAASIGIYRAIVSGTCGTKISDSVYVYVKKQNFSGEPEVFLWPSVTIDEFNVALSNDAIYSVNIYSINGQVIRELTNCRYQTTINVSETAKGTYIVLVFNSSFRKSLKMIKE